MHPGAMPVAPGGAFGRPMPVGPPSAAPGSPITAEIPLPMDWPMIGEIPAEEMPYAEEMSYAAEMPLTADTSHSAQALAAQALAEDVPAGPPDADQGPQYRTRRRHLRSVA